MELEQLKVLVSTLRALGVTKYRAAGVELELGEVPVADAARAAQKPARDPRVQELLDRAGPIYGDLLEIR